MSELALNKAAAEQLKAEVDECRSDKAVLASLETEVEDLRKQIHHNGLTIKRLTTACEVRIKSVVYTSGNSTLVVPVPSLNKGRRAMLIIFVSTRHH